MHRAWDETKHLTHELAEEAEHVPGFGSFVRSAEEALGINPDEDDDERERARDGIPNTGRGDARDAGTLGTTEMTTKTSRTVPVLNLATAGEGIANSGDGTRKDGDRSA